MGIATEQVRQFKLAWMQHAFIHNKEYQTICAGQLVGLLRDLRPPLGVGRKGSYYDCQILAKKVRVRIGFFVSESYFAFAMGALHDLAQNAGARFCGYILLWMAAYLHWASDDIQELGSWIDLDPDKVSRKLPLSV